MEIPSHFQNGAVATLMIRRYIFFVPSLHLFLTVHVPRERLGLFSPAERKVTVFFSDLRSPSFRFSRCFISIISIDLVNWVRFSLQSNGVCARFSSRDRFLFRRYPQKKGENPYVLFRIATHLDGDV